MAARTKYTSFFEGLQGKAERDQLKEMVRVMMQELMEEELTRHVGAEPHERTATRAGYRNGRKPRSLNTRLGKLDLEVPQVRGAEPYHPMFFHRWQRSERALLATCAEMYFMGVSTRKVSRVLEEMGGFSLSAATVSRVTAELDEKLEEFRSRPLGGHTWPYLIVDARYEKVRHAGRIVSRAVLIVAGVHEDGRREILTWRVGQGESEETWVEVFGELKRRGLGGVHLIVSDGHEGIRAAVERVFPEAAWQRCRVHFIRNALNKVSYKDEKVLAKELRALFQLNERDLCCQAAEEIAHRWAKKYPRLARQLEDQIEQCLAILEFPSTHRRRLHSTNMLERLMREVKRRTKVVGIFPNDASCDRLVGAMLIEYHEIWQCEQIRYVSWEVC
jgi:transposase-like protein